MSSPENFPITCLPCPLTRTTLITPKEYMILIETSSWFFGIFPKYEWVTDPSLWTYKKWQTIQRKHPFSSVRILVEVSLAARSVLSSDYWDLEGIPFIYYKWLIFNQNIHNLNESTIPTRWLCRTNNQKNRLHFSRNSIERNCNVSELHEFGILLLIIALYSPCLEGNCFPIGL